MIKLAGEKESLKVVNDQTGCPTYSKDLADAIIQIIKTHYYGIYHVSNDGSCSWYEYANEIFKIAGITNVNLIPCTTEEFYRPAKRPSYSVMNNLNYKLRGFKPLKDYKSALQEFLKK